MPKKILSLICATSILISSSAFAYKRDATPSQGEGQGPQQAPQEQNKPSDDDYGYGVSTGKGMMTAGYVLLIAGGAAAIAGSTIVAAKSDKRTLGAIVGGSGAALSLVGTLLLVFGSGSSYAVAPTIDPKHKSYGLALARRF